MDRLQEKPFLAAILTATTTFLLASCAGKIGVEPEPPGDFAIEGVFLPFVELVVLPAEIRAGREFEIALHVSANARPEVLTWLDADGAWLEEVYAGALVMNPRSWPDSSYDLVRPWVSTGSTSGAPVEIVTLRLTAVEAGVRTLRVQSAATPDQGGLEGAFWVGPDSDADTFPSTVYLDYSYTVLPAEGGS